MSCPTGVSACVVRFVSSLSPARRRSPLGCHALAQRPDQAQEAEGLKFRFLGPAAGNRIAAIVGVPGDSNVYYAGASSGGVWKTTDAGLNWKPIFDDQPVAAIGALAVAPSDPVDRLGRHRRGVGDPRHRRDGRRHLQVDRRREDVDEHGPRPRPGRIGRIIVHPTNPDIVFVCAVGPHDRPAAGARRLPDDRRRPALGARPVRGREHRLLGPLDGSERPEHAVRRHVAGRDAHVGDVQRRPGQRRLRVARRRRDVDAHRGARPAEVAGRQDRRGGRADQLEPRVRADPDGRPGLALAVGRRRRVVAGRELAARR